MNYKNLSIGLGFVVAFLIGCVAHQSVSALSVPPARAGTSPARWEYECAEVTDDVTTAVNRLGAEGWELVTAAGLGWALDYKREEKMVWCFKRPLG
jgi:hypothetical protein